MKFRELAIRRLAGALGLLLALSLALAPAIALAAAPQMSHVFYGTVTIDEEAAVVGTVISARVAGLEYTYTVEVEGEYGFNPAPPFFIPAEGLEDGDPIEFYIGDSKLQLYDVEAEESLDSYPFEIGDFTELNLSVGALGLTADASGPYSGIVGESIALFGEASGGTEPYTYAWDLDNDSTYETPGKDVSHSWSTAATYTISLRVTDNVSAIDTDTATVLVTEEGALAVTTASATGIGTTTATLNGNLTDLGDASSVEVSFEWGTSTSYGNETANQTMASTGSFNTALSGLSASTTYHFRAKAAAGEDTSLGDDRTFATLAPASGGGGGGGGGGAPTYYTETNVFGTEARFRISRTGEILATIEATSEDGMLTITIPKGTTALDEDGDRLGSLEAAVDESPPDPPEDTRVIGLAYDFGPDGATFDPPVTLTWSYDPEALPEGVAEEDLVIAYYDEVADEWVELDCVVDTANDTITASVEHFTSFAILGAVTPGVEPELETTIGELEAQVASAQGDYDTAKSAVAAAQAQLASAQGDYDTAKSDLAAAQDKLASAQGDYDTAKSSVAAAQGQVASLQSDLAVAQERLAEAETRVAELEATAPNWGLIGGIIAAVLIVVGLLVFFLVFRRRPA